jgi:hypothetical protein
MTEAKTYSPLKIGLLIVAVAYFLFAVHETFTLSWIGEWEYLTGSFSFDIFVEDISGYIGIIFRLIASIIALSTVILYFAKKSLSTSTITKALRWIIVMEAIYWLGLLVTSVISVQDLVLGSFSNLPANLVLVLLMSTATLLVESIAIPIVLFRLAFALNPQKLQKDAIKWGLITGTIYILVFWLSNTTMWASTITQKGTEYLTAYPENLLSFALTTIGLLALTVFTAYFTKKSVGTETVENLKLRTIGAIVLALGLYFLWNYLTWIFFGGDYLWSDWYAWFLGHNLDLWMLSLPLLGLPLLFKRKNLSKANTPTPPT